MHLTPIAELNPELSARDTKQFKAAVTLIWPWSSSQRQFALLLAEPDFRLRRNKGQVRARFSGSSAKALATTGVGIGDQVILSLRGARFIQEDLVSTPGRNIDWELEYTQTVAVQVFRHGTELANLELQDVAPTPAPPSPVRRDATTVATPTQQWSSPAFLKRARLSHGPFFEAPYDPLAGEDADAHDKKRRRRSYRDWKAWTYSARTPSPEKGHVDTEEELEAIDISPSRPSQLPRTPVSPPKPQMLSVAARPLQRKAAKGVEPSDNDTAGLMLDGASEADRNTNTKAFPLPENDNSARDEEHHNLDAGPDEQRRSDAQYAFGGDTEANTEEDEHSLADTHVMSGSETEADGEVMQQDDRDPKRTSSEPVPVSSNEAVIDAETSSTTKKDTMLHASESRDAVVVTIDGADPVEVEPADTNIANMIEPVIMPPPTLTILDTNFHVPASSSGPLTPLGKEPASPTLQPLDSALLPLPSPFPGERDANATSYFDQAIPGGQVAPAEVEEEAPPSDASYIMENSFFSSIGSSRADAWHPDHESAFTPVRFTFGLDGGSSRLLELSSPAPEEPMTKSIESSTQDMIHAAETISDEVPETIPQQDEVHAEVILIEAQELPVEGGSEAADSEAEGVASREASPETAESGAIELSSDSESEESDEYEEEAEEEAATEEVMGTKETGQDHIRPASNNGMINDSTIIDLGSPSASSELADEVPETMDPSEAGMDHPEVSCLVHTSFQEQDHAPIDNQPADFEFEESYSESMDMDSASALLDFAASTQDTTGSHTVTREGLQSVSKARENDASQIADLSEPFSAVDDGDALMKDNLLEAEPYHVQWPIQDQEETHPDVKLESIEDGTVLTMSQLVTQEEQERSTRPSDEMLIEVPNEGHILGEVHTISVPATGPARNTRSRTKISASPAKEQVSPPQRTTRSTRSRDPFAQTTMSPPTSQDTSTISPSVNVHQTSPYSLRSQSRLLSPTTSAFGAVVATRRSPRKRGLQQTEELVQDMETSQLPTIDTFLTSFQASQELDASQGRYSNVSFVRDSEEESMKSEHSISTIRYSDDWNTFTNFSDPLVEHEQEDTATLRPPPASAPQPDTRAATRAEWKRGASPSMILERTSPAPSNTSVIIPPSLNSPTQKLRSSGSVGATQYSPRATRQHSRHTSMVSQESENLSDASTPPAQVVSYPTLGVESEVMELASSPPASADVKRGTRRVTPVAQVTALSLQRQSMMQNDRPVTPDESQQNPESHDNNVTSDAQQQRLPMTPQLSQAPLSGQLSFTDSMTIEQTVVETPTKKDASRRITRSTPRRNATQTDVASRSTTPRARSPSPSSDVSATAVSEPPAPSIGLSTPLAYYTPLHSLVYFLNRSSQFSTWSNPDVLALVSSPTTRPQRATKGRKDWSTTLHVTDLSSFPSTTTVNVFRPYQSALPVADTGDVILLRAFAVHSFHRQPALSSADESSWCVWRYAKPLWSAKRGPFGEIKAREEVKGPHVERGEGEWSEVDKIRAWYLRSVKAELDAKTQTRSRDPKDLDDKEEEEKEAAADEAKVGSQRVTRSRDKRVQG
ncbi:hypothetical protein ACEQ8H_004605 [Pleosporales sp. CAS-2024a]